MSLSHELSSLKEEGLFRSLPQIESRDGAHLYASGQMYVDFSSNDYLGLSQHPLINKKAADYLQQYGWGSTGSRLLSGDHELFHELETALSQFKEKESSLLFSSGYMASLGVLQALSSKGVGVFADRLIHASWIDACRLSGVPLHRYHHGDLDHLETLLSTYSHRYHTRLLLTESVFSMDGDLADLDALVQIKNQHEGLVIVDEAHGTGLYGEQNQGLIQEKGLSDDVDLILTPFGKALGSMGGGVSCSEEMKSLLINKGRSFMFTTALPPMVAGVNCEAIRLCQEMIDERNHVLQLASQFRDGLSALELSYLGESAIVPVLLGDTDRTLMWSNKLKENGIWVPAIRFPTVPKDQCRLRFTFTSAHTTDHVQQVLDVLRLCKQEEPHDH